MFLASRWSRVMGWCPIQNTEAMQSEPRLLGAHVTNIRHSTRRQAPYVFDAELILDIVPLEPFHPGPPS